jgi:hypothetical protein
MRRLLIALALAAAFAGCGRSGDRDEARVVVERFYDAVRQDRGEVACAQLSEAAAAALASQSEEPCDTAVSQLDLDRSAVARAQVFVTSARVELRGGESAFLDLEPDGWRISAVGCRPEQGAPAEVPMDCEVQA